MEFNKSLLMPVCIMVKTLKSGVDFTGCCLLFDLLGSSPTFACCRWPGAPMKPHPPTEMGWEGALGRGGEGREGEQSP